MPFDRHKKVERLNLPRRSATHTSIASDGRRPHGGRPLVYLVRQDLGDVTAAPNLIHLFHANRDMILRYIRAHGLADTAEDLLQELWLKVERAPPVVEVTRAYLMKMAHNLIIDEARAAKRQRARDHTWQDEGAGLLDADPAPNAEQVVMIRDALRRTEQVLRQLGPKTERILRRHRIDGVSQKQLAVEEGLSLSSVEKHLQKAYRALASMQIDMDSVEGQLR